MPDNNIIIKKDGDIVTKAVLISVITDDMTEEQAETSLEELKCLLETAGGEAAAIVTQSRATIDNRTFIGKGKAEETAEFIKNEGDITLAVIDNELTPSQIRNLEDILDIRVIDRTMLILDIFALHAVTAEGKLQVEIACLKYTAPRLIGKGLQMSRLGGGIGTRGPGESQIETDRRHLKRRLEALTEKLCELERSRDVIRKGRDKVKMKTVAIAGYTNAGKSTLLNYLTGAGVLSENKLFATLDPTTRKLTLPEGEDVLLVDTVGFIDRLPTHLVKAFKSTLEEIKYADLIICLVDSSECDGERMRKTSVTEKLIREICGEEKPVVLCYNKYDNAVDTEFVPKDAVCVSAKTGENVEKLLEKVKEILSGGKKRIKFFFPHTKLSEMYSLQKYATILSTEYTDNGATVLADCDAEAEGKFSTFILNA